MVRGGFLKSNNIESEVLQSLIVEAKGKTKTFD